MERTNPRLYLPLDRRRMHPRTIRTALPRKKSCVQPVFMPCCTRLGSVELVSRLDTKCCAPTVKQPWRQHHPGRNCNKNCCSCNRNRNDCGRPTINSPCKRPNWPVTIKNDKPNCNNNKDKYKYNKHKEMCPKRQSSRRFNGNVIGCVTCRLSCCRNHPQTTTTIHTDPAPCPVELLMFVTRFVDFDFNGP